MHYGVFKGEKAKNQPVKYLILGESHHVSTDPKVTTDKVAGVPASYTTASVIQEHLDKRKTHDFLTKIAKTFGSEEEDAFWQSVYFGNYIDVLCGIGNSVAKNQIKEQDNRIKYNDQLFQFVNEHKIEKIFCFSILAYKSLPSLSDDEESKCETVGRRGNRRVFLRQCQYKAGTQHKGASVILQQDLHVYGISHPQAKGGYSPEMYAKVLKGQLRGI